MKNQRLKKFFMFASIGLVGFSLLASDGHLRGEEQDPAAKPAIKKKVRAKQRGRLPAHYRKIVNDTQREKIYAIQAKYRQKIADLQAQVNALKTKRAEEMDALLTKDQKF